MDSFSPSPFGPTQTVSSWLLERDVKGYRLRLFVLDVAKTKEVEIGREIFTPREGTDGSQIYQEATEAGTRWREGYKCLQ
jgi:hypothetical protein